jgi:hypothetical protein
VRPQLEEFDTLKKQFEDLCARGQMGTESRALFQALAAWECAAIEQIITLPAMHVDETSLRVDRKNHWIHVCAAGEITLKFLHPTRGREAMGAFAVIPRYGGVLIHNCWASHLAYAHCDHGLCGSHLLRELTFVVDANGYAWAANIKALPPKPTVASPATCSPWPTKDTIRWWLSKWRSPVNSISNRVSSYLRLL